MDKKQPDQDEPLAPEATQKRSACLHHWVIDPPKGRVSKGTCRSCGEERDFLNYAERPYNTWDRNPGAEERT